MGIIMDRIDSAVKFARDCHTQGNWDQFLSLHADTLTQCSQPRLINDVFRQLSSDPQSLNYNPTLWASLLQGSLACWNYETGCQIAEFVKRLTSPQVNVLAAQILYF